MASHAHDATELRAIAKRLASDKAVASLAVELYHVADCIDDRQHIAVDLNRNFALVNGVEIRLRPKAAELLACLLPGGFRQYERLYFGLWGQSEIPLTASNTMKVHASILRSALAGTGYGVLCHWGHGLELVYDRRAIPH